MQDEKENAVPLKASWHNSMGCLISLPIYHSFPTISQRMNQKGLKKRYVNALAMYFRHMMLHFQQAITQSGAAEGGGGWLNSVSSFISKTFYW